MQQSIKQIVSATLIAGSVAVGSFSFSSSASADIASFYEPAFLRVAEQALERDLAEDAIDIIERNMSSATKRYQRAEAEGIACRAHLTVGSPEDARDACLRALDIEEQPTRWRFLNNLGVAELQLGNLDAAEDAFVQAKMLNRSEKSIKKNLEIVRALSEQRAAAASEQVASSSR